MPRVARRPLHAGSWYEEEGTSLVSQIDEWLAAAECEPNVHAKAIIGPHAGYQYCGHVMAHAYKQIDPSKVSTVFLLGPSHHIFTRKCVLSRVTDFSTPLGDMEIDARIYSELQATGLFETMGVDSDEAEHSLELHTPYIARVMGGRPFKLVPIMVGALSFESEARYGKVLAPYIDDPSTLFVISSDFCHWGLRFSYTPHDQSFGPIYKYVEWLDQRGMQLIEEGDTQAFSDYLKLYGNTICGRHPIAILLQVLDQCETRHKISFKKYAQSSQVRRFQDSSVSYAAAVVTVAE